ncbi:cell wall hydrolase [Paenibacillus sp. YN15]|uniref:cell wall hydrolase n=1 Tax=Paenibacillus sp. YN15 TaxID=1742774 RepID=UPI000DCBD080|nr:cell wall hydrolase [Paenibacillus sp. YN15]RAV00178.1 hypothetical protein DQG13_14585 [Paenibacillus sp. YN15]
MAWGDPIQNLSGLSEFDPLDVVDIMARLIYSEARGESTEGKVGVRKVLDNRYDHPARDSEFGGDTYKEIMLKPYAFEGLTTISAREPDTNSTAWDDCVSVTLGTLSVPNPIGNCLWFVTNSYFNNNVIQSGGEEYWNFGAGNKKIVEKVIVDNQTFFRVEGY